MIIERSSDWEEGFINRLNHLEQWQSWTLYKMSYDTVKMKLIPDFTGLQATNYLPNLKPLKHQLEGC